LPDRSVGGDVVAKVLWKGAISFSLIHIPVSLHTAARANELDLDLLDRRDFAPVGYQRINKTTGKPVEWDDIVKGYQYKKGQYVVLTDEDFRRANVEATQTIDIQAFVRPGEIAPYFFETPYYLAPDKRGMKVYALLREALRKSDRWAVGSVVIRTRAYTCVLLPHEDLLLLNTLRYVDEMVAADAIDAPKGTVKQAGVTPKEFELALKLVTDMTDTWSPGQYKDTYRDDLLKRVEEKAKKGETRTLTEATGREPARKGAEIIDLTTLLKRSLANAPTGKASGKASATPASRGATRRAGRSGPRRRA
jgi:DNA end-binding protein Ku